MRIAVFDEYRIGVVGDDGVHDVTAALPGWRAELAPYLVNDFIARFAELRPAVEQLARDTPPRPLDQVRLRPPVPRPTHVFAAPVNYRAHQAEMKGSPMGSNTGLTAAELGFFLKATGSLSGASDPIELPARPDRRFDHEGELAFVIGRQAQGVSRDQALDHVFGYTILVDCTMRMTATQREERVLRKSFASFAPLGPWIVTADEIPDPSRLTIKLWVNGVQQQDASLTDLIVDVPGLIEQASAVLPLLPGDVYTTGSPAGVGELHPGDEVVVEIAGVGRMTLPVRTRDW
jgi:2-keto-4-pentenoate hydratase/2-oxohepta-3-ene-1,7-dioic acid hydratase in catechol pathway